MASSEDEPLSYDMDETHGEDFEGFDGAGGSDNNMGGGHGDDGTREDRDENWGGDGDVSEDEDEDEDEDAGPRVGYQDVNEEEGEDFDLAGLNLEDSDDGWDESDDEERPATWIPGQTAHRTLVRGRLVRDVELDAQEWLCVRAKVAHEYILMSMGTLQAGTLALRALYSDL
ncbi:hypothetical protein SISSUDRAFT_1066931 [Sistotremastrum suecicum HHB10207 ss-3]|uniref:Uncharacterized protein n=1 Tax=Sistotremastrum suecicum HHB10207 ss-3 TaxID=1314776 RepID=A0A165XQG2_9AGAM|nr:hypothetical protein SISSUDRAFT_1066931 [Sistotremastrum suecicum HHB10207 ss-3]